jgi:hypothetical protein
VNDSDSGQLKPYKSIRDIPSKDDIRSSDLDRYLEESSEYLNRSKTLNEC